MMAQLHLRGAHSMVTHDQARPQPPAISQSRALSLQRVTRIVHRVKGMVPCKGHSMVWLRSREGCVEKPARKSMLLMPVILTE
jgi:hypothetical protein